MEQLLSALDQVLTLEVLATMVVASVFGLLLGAIPGLTATMGAALLVPIAFFLDPLPAIAAVVAVATSAIFAGDLPGALLRIPGTPASAAYVDDAYALTKRGKAPLGLGVSLIAAVIGGTLGTLILVFGAQYLARFALGFSSTEYFWLAALGLSCAVIVSGRSKLKGFASLFIGLFIACVGIDVIAGYPRFTFGTVELMGGVAFIPALIGMFALAEILRNLARGSRIKQANPQPVIENRKSLVEAVGAVARHKVNVARGGVLGTIIGALPGAGADIASWIAYAVSKRASKTPEKFGSGHTEGLSEAGAANNGALAGAWIPALVFGIPGDTITAIAIGILMVKGLQPGPTIFLMQGDLIYAIFIAFFIANIVLLPLGLIAIRAASQIVRVPQNIMLPLILIFCIVGSYGVSGSAFGIGVMLVIGVLGWLMTENDIPLAPAILGIVLGEMVEFNFVTSLVKSDGDLMVFFDRPIGAVLGVVTIAVWLITLANVVVRAPKSDAMSTGAPKERQ